MLFSIPAKETNKPTIQKKRIRVIGNNGVVETYEGRLTITNDTSQCVTFEDEVGVRHKILNQGGFIIIDYYNE